MTFFDRRFDPLTRTYTRSTNALATSVDYAQSVEPHDPIDSSWHRDWLYQIAVIVCALSTLGVLGILTIELLGLTK